MSSPEPTVEDLLNDLISRIRTIGGAGGATLSELPGRPGVFDVSLSDPPAGP